MKSLWFEIRKKAGLSQKQIAEMFGVSKSYIANMESGMTHMPDKYKEFYLSLSNKKKEK